MVLQIVAIIGIVAFVCLVIYLIILIVSANKVIKDAGESLNKISTTMDTSMRMITRDLGDLKKEVVESLDVMNNSMSRVNRVFDNVNDEIGKIGAIIEPFEDLSKFVYKKVEPPVVELTNFVSGLYKGVSTFINFFSFLKK